MKTLITLMILFAGSLSFSANADEKIVSFCDQYNAKPGGATAEELKRCR